jgi:hypothetical protein
VGAASSRVTLVSKDTKLTLEMGEYIVSIPCHLEPSLVSPLLIPTKPSSSFDSEVKKVGIVLGVRVTARAPLLAARLKGTSRVSKIGHN